MNDDKAMKARAFLLANLGFILVTVTVVIYLFYGWVTLDETGKTLERIILDSVIAWVVGFSIARMLEYQGFLIGDKNESVKNTKELHGKTTEDISPDIECLDDWCEEQNALALKTARTSILSEAGLKYDGYFRKDGTVIDENLETPKSKIKVVEERNKKKRAAVRRALDCKITPLSTNSLTTSYGSKKYDPYDFGMTKSEYTAKSTLSAAIQKVLLGIGFGYFTIQLIDDPEWGYLIYTGIQVGIFLLLGGITMVKAYFFVVEAQREATIKKINNLEKFKNIDKTKYKEALKNGGRSLDLQENPHDESVPSGIEYSIVPTVGE